MLQSSLALTRDRLRAVRRRSAALLAMRRAARARLARSSVQSVRHMCFVNSCTSIAGSEDAGALISAPVAGVRDAICPSQCLSACSPTHAVPARRFSAAAGPVSARRSSAASRTSISCAAKSPFLTVSPPGPAVCSVFCVWSAWTARCGPARCRLAQPPAFARRRPAPSCPRPWTRARRVQLESEHERTHHSVAQAEVGRLRAELLRRCRGLRVRADRRPLRARLVALRSNLGVGACRVSDRPASCSAPGAGL